MKHLIFYWIQFNIINRFVTGVKEGKSVDMAQQNCIGCLSVDLLLSVMLFAALRYRPSRRHLLAVDTCFIVFFHCVAAKLFYHITLIRLPFNKKVITLNIPLQYPHTQRSKEVFSTRWTLMYCIYYIVTEISRLPLGRLISRSFSIPLWRIPYIDYKRNAASLWKSGWYKR